MEEATNPATTAAAAAGSGRDTKSPHMGTWSTKQQNGLIGDMGYPSTSGTTADVIFVVEDEATDAAVPGSFTASHPDDEDDEEIERFEVDVALGRVTRM